MANLVEVENRCRRWMRNLRSPIRGLMWSPLRSYCILKAKIPQWWPLKWFLLLHNPKIFAWNNPQRALHNITCLSRLALLPHQLPGSQVTIRIRVFFADPKAFPDSCNVNTAFSTGTEDSWRRGAVTVAQSEVCFLQTLKDSSLNNPTNFSSGLS